MSLWASKLVSGQRLTVMTHCCARNAPLLLPLERLSACKDQPLDQWPGVSSCCEVCVCVCVCAPEESGSEREKGDGRKANERE